MRWIYPAVKNNEILPFATTWIELEGIMQNVISQRKISTVWYHLYVEILKYSKLVNMTKKKSRRRYREQTSGYQWGEGIGEEQYRGEGVIYKLIYKINCKDIFYNTENIVNIL